MKRYLAVLMGAILLLVMVVFALAQEGPAMPRPGRQMQRHFGLGKALQNKEYRTKLGVTDEQYAKLEAAFLNSAKTAIRTRADLEIKRMELGSLMKADNVDRAQVLQKVNEITALQGALMKTHIEGMMTLKETLTPEQLEKLKQLRQGQARRGMGQRMQGRMGGGPGQPGMWPRGQQQPGMGPGGPPQGPQAPKRPQAPPKPGDGSSL
jgi:Spy/CpxP family protein refolding chaperone